MASLKLHRQCWQAKVRIPKELRSRYEGREFIYRHLSTSDRRKAKLEADAWEAGLRLEWAAARGEAVSTSALRSLYQQLRQRAEAGEFVVESGDADPIELGIEHELERLSEQYEARDIPAEAEYRLAALQDAQRARAGRSIPRRAILEPTMREVANDYLTLWKTQHGLKETNTEQQKIATFDLFAGFLGDKPLRAVRKADAARFVDALRQMDPNWARSPAAKGMSWAQLQQKFGGRPKGLSDATVNRHMATLQALWDWALDREHCEGRNPFSGFQRKLREGRNTQGYVAWEPEELTALFTPPPKREDLTELMLVAMFSGMRLDEIASLTGADVHHSGPVPFVRVTDAKTIAGNRDVPLHPALSWLIDRAKENPKGRIWPAFNAEGPGKKPGADAGKEFSRFKASRGFTRRAKVFHSFRKNFVGQLERARVPEHEVAQIVGHEKKGITFKVYGDRVMSLERKAEIVKLIDYKGLSSCLRTARHEQQP
ncbi:DUF6538 domain-containing protein [Sphingobium sp. B11D3D]|uniref:DUF6538 domain-containing protein n=1 Tax=Sphingobium sp. B11D3D TaxID=2940576 RepID=UPI002224EBE6|nr:DUF6538 domain-containing protein [Sphingobium sp. B11D3D]MCW2369927.1 integrase [Sphingobium sp. B11D3D]